jgi:hypothetical protein
VKGFLVPSSILYPPSSILYPLSSVTRVDDTIHRLSGGAGDQFRTIWLQSVYGRVTSLMMEGCLREKMTDLVFGLSATFGLNLLSLPLTPVKQSRMVRKSRCEKRHVLVCFRGDERCVRLLRLFHSIS